MKFSVKSIWFWSARTICIVCRHWYLWYYYKQVFEVKAKKKNHPKVNKSFPKKYVSFMRVKHFKTSLPIWSVCCCTLYNMYAAMTLPAMVANPPVQMAWSSDLVILEMKGRIKRGASLCKEIITYTVITLSFLKAFKIYPKYYNFL